MKQHLGTILLFIALAACAAEGSGYSPGNVIANNNVGTPNNSTDGNVNTGNSGNTNDTGTNLNATYTGTDISGVVLSLGYNGTNVSLDHITLEVVDVNTGNSLQEIALDATQSACATTGCPFQFKKVDLTGQIYGLVIVAKDSRTGAAATWVPAGTATATPDQVNSAILNGTAFTNQHVFPVSIAARTALGASSIGKAQNANLNTVGSVLGVVIGSASEATAASNFVPPPVGNATVTGPGTATIYYPNAALTGKGNATAPGSGLFVAVPNSSTRVYGLFGVTAGQGDTHAWPSYALGINAGFMLVTLFEAN